MKKCFKCSAEMSDSDEFCHSCGTKQPAATPNSFCMQCGTQLNSNARFCPSCGTPKGKAQHASATPNNDTIISKLGLESLTASINKMTGESGAVKLNLSELFSNVFKKHTREESENIFVAGTAQTTPAESEIVTSWPKPWLFSRVFLALLISSALLYFCVIIFENVNMLPGLMFLGALTIPFSILVFFFETNVPRNISIFEVIKMFFIGGTASLVLTLFLFEILPAGELDYWAAIIVGFVEELGKLLAIAFFVRMIKPRYILNGLLIGAAIGAGFAVFETAGYAFRYFVGSGFDIDTLLDILFLRGWTSLGGHVAWAAIIGAGLVMVKGDSELKSDHFINRRFLKFFIVPVILHAIWDCPFMGDNMGTIVIKLLLLIILAWIYILVILSAGLKQIERISANTAQPSKSAMNTYENVNGWSNRVKEHNRN